MFAFHDKQSFLNFQKTILTNVFFAVLCGGNVFRNEMFIDFHILYVFHKKSLKNLQKVKKIIGRQISPQIQV